MSSLEFRFLKIVAAGNDFVFVNAIASTLSEDRVKKLCDRHFGIGSDGLVAYWQGPNQEWSWNFWNPDGSPARVCGNAARSLGSLLLKKSPALNEVRWRGTQGEFAARRISSHAEHSQTEVTWELKPENIFDRRPEAKTRVDSIVRALKPSWVAAWNSGVPHLVLAFDRLPAKSMRLAVSPQLRDLAEWGPDGANVTWLDLSSHNIVTFERGVEGETLACGSGGLAAAIALETENTPGPWTLHFPGGTLGVRRDGGRLWQSGPVELVFEGVLT